MGADLRWGSSPQEGVSLSQLHAQPALGTCCEWLIQANLCLGSQIRSRLGERVFGWRQATWGQVMPRVSGQLEGIPNLGWRKWLRSFRLCWALKDGR